MRMNAMVSFGMKKFVTIGPETWICKFERGGLSGIDASAKLPVDTESTIAAFMTSSDNIAVGAID
jgi:hypothetical protein